MSVQELHKTEYGWAVATGVAQMWGLGLRNCGTWEGNTPGMWLPMKGELKVPHGVLCWKEPSGQAARPIVGGETAERPG